MNKILLALSFATLPMAGFADVTVYGKANVSFQSTDEKGDSVSELVSNASRIGVKGSEQLTDGLKAIYKFEYEVHLDDGDKDGRTFTQRNIYVGLQGSAGTVIAGKFDTPLKVAQKKIDLFNDLEGDIKSIITKNDNRESNSVMYTTPKSMGPFKASVAYIASEDDDRDDGTSLSLAYDQNGIYLAVAYDQDVEKESADVFRVVGQFTIGPVQLGALYEDQDAGDSSLLDDDGWVVSVKYKMTDKIALKAQYGESDMVKVGAETASLGLDYKLSKKTKLFAFYTSEEADTLADDNDYVGVGMEMKF